MVVTAQKNIEAIKENLKGYTKIFLVGCGECATTCKTGGKDEVGQMRSELEKIGKNIVGSCIPGAPCIAAQVKSELAKNMPALRQAEVILVLACGLGAQSVKENNRLGHVVLPACDTLFSATVDARGDFYEKCSLCGDCVLDLTAGICPVTLCSKGLLNGPCGGTDKGKCEADKDKDCAWVLIYEELKNRAAVGGLNKIQPPKDFKKALKPRKLIIAK